MESFLGALESERLCLTHYKISADAERSIAEYVYFYNVEHINQKNGLAPVGIRSKAAQFVVFYNRGLFFVPSMGRLKPCAQIPLSPQLSKSHFRLRFSALFHLD